MSSGLKISLAIVVVAIVVGISIYNSESNRNSRFIAALVERNIEARGGADAWEAVSTLRTTGQLDLGQGLAVPYTMEQKRPGRMCFEFEFMDETSVQCVAGDSGWKVVPFQNRRTPESMTVEELREIADLAGIDGLLFGYSVRGHEVSYLGEETIEGRPAHKLYVKLPLGGERWVYLDQETALEIMIESRRTLSGEKLRVFTKLQDWQETDGVLIARYQETQIEGRAESNFMTVEQVSINPEIDDTRFAMPSKLADLRTASAAR